MLQGSAFSIVIIKGKGRLWLQFDSYFSKHVVFVLFSKLMQRTGVLLSY